MAREGTRKRRRAAVVAEQDGKVLLVKERDSTSVQPAGQRDRRAKGCHYAACRELCEETGLCVVQARYLFDHEGHVMFYKVVGADEKDDVRLRRRELSDSL